MAETAAQAQALTSGEDMRPKRRYNLVANASQPNRKREGGHLWSNFIVLGLCIAGLVLTMHDKVRGDSHLFLVSFAVCIGISGAEIFLNLVLMICTGRCCSNDGEQDGCCKKCTTGCIAILINLIYLIGCGVCFGFLVAALISSSGIAETEAYGCVNNYGCANILAICASIIYGFRLLIIVACLPCLICAGICACSVCCADAVTADRPLAAVDGGESGQPQNSSL